MKVLAALLLAVLLIGDATPYSTENPPKSTHGFDVTTKSSSTDGLHDRGNTLSTAQTKYSVVPDKTTSKSKLDDPLLDERTKSFLNPKDLLLQEIHTLDEEASNDKIQDEVAQTFKAEAQRIRLTSTSTAKTVSTTRKVNVETSSTTAADDIPYDDLDDDEDEEDESEDDYDDDGTDDELDDEEEVMTQCPDYCKCAGQYATATTATCTKLVVEQSFRTSIAHLRIENAGEIRLGPRALLSLGLQQLESVGVIDTRITELDRAFDGIPYLFSVNLTRNGLQDIHPNIFLNNTQLRLLTISGNLLAHAQDSKVSKHYLFDAPSVAEFDFSYNGLAKLKHNAFLRMPNLSYINLKGNRLRDIDRATFSSLESLVELDLSHNLLLDIPDDLFYNLEVQTLRIAGNLLHTLSSIKSPKLTELDASNNKIKVIAKEDLLGAPLLDKLTVSNNGLKKIHPHAFADLDQLTYLDISGNKLASLTEHHLRTNSRLQTLLMNDNPELEVLPVFKTSGLEYDTYSVSRFDCANCGLYNLEEDTFNAMPALTRLNLARNRLSALPNGLLTRLSSLRVLDLSDNIIGSIGPDMLSGAISLTKLNLAGNPLVTLQVSPFLSTPSLTRLDVSRCALERVWSEARVPLNSLRFLSIRGNLLRRITVEELKATPKISGLDLSHNPLDCDDEFNAAVQWLTDRGVTPTETLRYESIYGNDDYQDSEGISQWTDLAKIVCDGVEDGPPPRPVPRKESKPDRKPKPSVGTLDEPGFVLKNDLGSDEILKFQIDHGMRPNEIVDKAWSTQDQEYEDFVAAENSEYRPWYNGALWPVVTVVVVTLMILLLTAHIAIHLAKRRGRGPVIRPPMILRQGLIDNKNCGLVYKPLQEEIATPHMPKRGSFYSSSTFHYDKIVPESV